VFISIKSNRIFENLQTAQILTSFIFVLFPAINLTKSMTDLIRFSFHRIFLSAVFVIVSGCAFGVTVTVNLFDSYGDGWNGANWVIYN